MGHLTDEQLLELDFQGIIPGPKENEEDFLKRSQYCLKLRDRFKEVDQQGLPFLLEEGSSQEILHEAFPVTSSLYGIEPQWIPLFFSNYKLFPWHGGCAWIFQMDESSPVAAFFQLRQAFRSSKVYLGIYHRKELMAHELSHVGRMLFMEPRFEEILAYRSSSSWFQRTFGPLVEASWESAIFVLILFFIVLADIAVLTTGYSHYYLPLQALKVVPMGMLVYALIRLWKRQRVFSRCLDRVKDITKDEKRANAFVYRLTDEEIDQFADMGSMEILESIKGKKEASLRWRLLNLIVG